MPALKAQIVRRLKAGETIFVRAKNGDCIPMLHRRPDAYCCMIGKTRIPGQVVKDMMNRRTIVAIDYGWYSQGRFRFNKNLRDDRGRFLPRTRT